jgi:hypothetical protein
MTSKVSTRGHVDRTRCWAADSGAPDGTKKFVRAHCGGLSSCFAPGDDLVRCARM